MTLDDVKTALTKKAARPWVAGFVLGALIFVPGLAQLAQLSWKEHRLARREQQLKAAQAELSKERDRLTNDPAHIENLIRTTYKVSQPGELVVPLASVDKKPSGR